MSKYTVICISKVASEDWLNKPPFTSYATDTDGYAFSSSGTFSGVYGFRNITGRLHSIGKIVRKVNVLENVGVGDTKISGVGGVASASEFSFSLVNTLRDINVVYLYNKQVTVYSVNDDIIESPSLTVRYTGRIFEIERCAHTVNILCKGLLTALDKEIGTLVDNSTADSKGEIVPIVYGNFSDSDSFIPSVQDVKYAVGESKFGTIPEFLFDTEDIKTITALKIFDSESKKSYSASVVPSVANLSDGNTKLSLMAANNYMRLLGGCNDTEETLYIYNPVVIRVFFGEAPSPALTAHTYEDSGSRYEDEAGITYEFLGSEGDFYLFSTDDPEPLGKEGGNWTNNYGSGPDNLMALFRYPAPDDVLCPKQFIREDAELASPVIIKIDDEEMLIIRQSLIRSETYLGSSSYLVKRGVNGTTAASHLGNAVVYSSAGVYDESNLVMEQEFWPKAITSFGVDIPEPTISEYSSFITDQNYNGEVAAITELTKKYDTGETGGLVRVFPPTEANYLGSIGGPGKEFTLQLDLVFDTPGIDGKVINAYMLGKYSVFKYSTDLDELTTSRWGVINLRIGGLARSEGSPFWKFSVPKTELPEGATLQPVLVSELNSLLPCGVGMKGYPWRVEQVMYQRIESHPYITRSVTGVSSRTISHLAAYFREANPTSRFEVVEAPYYFSDGAMDLVEVMPNWEWNDNDVADYLTNKYDYKLGNLFDVDFVAGRDERKHGLVDTLSGLLSRRMYLEFIISGTHTMISNPGLLVQFRPNLSNLKLYAEGEGRVDTFGFTLENPASTVKDIIDKELGVTLTFNSAILSAAAARLSGFKSTLVLSGTRPNLLKELDAFSKGTALVISEDKEGQICIDSIIPKLYSEITKVLTESDIQLVDDSVDFDETYTGLSNVVTGVDVLYKKNHASDTIYGGKLASADFPIGLDILNSENRVSLYSDYVRDEDSAEILSDIVKDYYSSILRTVRVKVKQSTDVRVGEFIGITSTYLNTTGKPMLVIGYEEQLLSESKSNEYVDLTLLVWDTGSTLDVS